MSETTQQKLEAMFMQLCKLTPEEAKIAANLNGTSAAVPHQNRAGWPSNDPRDSMDRY